MNYYNCVYMYFNLINNKCYIGQTIDFNRRNKEHISSSYNEKSKGYMFPFHKSLRKYGIDNFKVLILKENLKNQDELNYWECFYINIFNTTNKNKGYNVSSGGSDGNPYKGKTKEEMEITRRKMKENHADFKGSNHPQYGKHLNQGKNNPMFGKHHTEETKDKISKSNKGKNKGKNNHMYGKCGKESPNAKKIAQYDKNGKLIKIWDCMIYIEQELNINHGNISKCCNGKQKTAGGFIWKYADTQKS